MPMPRRSRKAATPGETAPLIRLWLLRILVPLGAHVRLINETYYDTSGVGIAVGLSVPEEGTAPDSLPAAKQKLKALHRAAEGELRSAEPPGCLRDNVTQLAGLVGLSEIDCRILEFVVLLQMESVLEEATDALGTLTSVRTFAALSEILDIDESEIHRSLGSGGMLVRSGLVKVEIGGSYNLRAKLDLLSGRLADRMVLPSSDPIGMIRDMVAPCSEGELDLGDYGHIDKAVRILVPYLHHSITSGRRGVNIFVHGQPGTGKSQFALALAAELRCKLFEVTSEDSDGDPVGGERRLRAFRAAQNFFSHRDTLLVFDEVEDIFNDGSYHSGRPSTASHLKRWINKTLEENRVPTIWLSNRIDGVDPAFVRRFDMVVELPVPPRKQREQILGEICTDLLDDPGIRRIARSEVLAPAVVSRAASVVRAIHDRLDPAQRSSTVELLISTALEAQGHPPIPDDSQDGTADLYDPRFIQADADLAEVGAGLAKTKFGRLCLYGPPGTGKTAWGRWLAGQIGVPLHVKRGSDLMSKWLGDNEKNIARAFRNAREDGAVLLIDEVDSFLMDRRGASQSWQVSLVNEMLTQMESFPGIFIASTNLMTGLDQAALRRFDLKVRFDFLKSGQASELFRRYCSKLGFTEPDGAQLLRLTRSRFLTPGDFSAVMRQGRFRPLSGADAFLEALEGECGLKEGAKPAIGFVH